MISPSKRIFMNSSHTPKISKKLKHLRLNRYLIINSIYLSELENRLPQPSDWESLGIKTPELTQVLQAISLNYNTLKNQVTPFLKPGFSWETNFALLRSVLIVGAYLLYSLDPGIVIDELVTYTKLYIPGEFYRFVHKVLDNLGQVHEHLKRKKET